MQTAVLALLPLALPSTRQEARVPAIDVAVDPRIEVLAVVQYLSGYGAVPGLITRYDVAYKKTVEEEFGGLRGEPAVATFDALSRRGFAFDAPVAAVLHCGPPPELEPRAEIEDALVERAGSREELEGFLEALRSFARTAEFMDFFASQREFHASIVADARAAMKGLDVAMLERYFGEQRAGYHIVLSPLLHHGAFGPRIAARDGSIEIYSVGGPYGAREGRPSFGTADDFRYLVWHEFSHSFVNPLVDRSGDAFDRTDVLFVPLEEQMRSQGYGLWRNCVQEHVVRACTVRFAFREGGAKAGKAALADELGRGFLHVEALAWELERYEDERERYRTLADFLPALLEVFESAAAEAELDPALRKPRVLGTFPQNGARDVDPAVTEILVHFDQDMDRGSYAWMQNDPERFPAQTGEPAFLSSRTAVLRVTLEPEHDYWIGINSGGIGGFRSATGVSAASAVIEFRTRAAAR